MNHFENNLKKVIIKKNASAKKSTLITEQNFKSNK